MGINTVQYSEIGMSIQPPSDVRMDPFFSQSWPFDLLSPTNLNYIQIPEC